MRVVFVNRYFRPDHSATSQIASDLAFALAARGVEVLAITSRQRYDDPGAGLPVSETVESVQILRVRTPTFGRGNLVGRALDYAGFYLGAMMRVLRSVRRGDVVVAMTDPPLLGVALWPAAALRGARLVHWLQDLFPEVAERLGVGAIRPVAGLLRRLRNAALRKATATVVIGDAMAALVQAQCGRVSTVIPNWALEEGEVGASQRRQDHPLRHEWGLGSSFIVGYSGNMGRAHQLMSLIDAATVLRDDPGIVFLFVGDGAQRASLQRTAQERGLGNVRFQPYQPRERLRSSLTLPDIHVASLDPRLEGLIVPSKFVGVIALGKPMLWLGAKAGEVGALILKSGAGMVVPPNDGTAVAAAVRAVARDAAKLEAMGCNARALWRERFRRPDALERWQHLLEGIINA
ncbi:MAG: glycosyltransferase family 4 protein [Gammaproteobacteria bacterium]|nr:glycosyltransferase family 4 protein [Gammaproteobacteria bacterium]